MAPNIPLTKLREQLRATLESIFWRYSSDNNNAYTEHMSSILKFADVPINKVQQLKFIL